MPGQRLHQAVASPRILFAAELLLLPLKFGCGIFQ
jgi:hypothetical protein